MQGIAASGLITFEGDGGDITEPLARLAAAPGVISATAFGQTIHVSGADRVALEAGLAPWRRPPFQWREVKPSLEDVFIQLMSAGPGPAA